MRHDLPDDDDYWRDTDGPPTRRTYEPSKAQLEHRAERERMAVYRKWALRVAAICVAVALVVVLISGGQPRFLPFAVLLVLAMVVFPFTLFFWWLWRD